MSTSSEPGIEEDLGADTPASSPRRGRAVLTWVLSALLVVVIAVAGTFAVTTCQQKKDDDAAQADRSAALSVAEQFTLRLDAIDYKHLDTYRSQVSALLTPKMKTDFTQSIASFDQAFTAVELVSKGTVQVAGVSDIDQDSATVLVIHDVNVTTKGCAQPPYKRMKVELRKIKGKWLVDDFEEGVPGCQGGGQ
ncbi:MAG: hypothetical protein JWO46_812 [Nocardioidaceae bacterium]|nr:hypothetical protein [Nocardioidaceae bacterium]